MSLRHPSISHSLPIFVLLLVFVVLTYRVHGFWVTEMPIHSNFKSALQMIQNRHIFGEGPLLAVITEPCACDSEERAKATLTAITRAVTTRQVHLVSIRLSMPPENSRDAVYRRALKMTTSLLDLASEHPFQVVCSSDWIDLAKEAQAHGIHVKESHLSQIPSIRSLLGDTTLIGTSTHSIESATGSYQTFEPDYYFCGTCFMTASHPEKNATDLEGPSLPGQVQRALSQASREAGSEYRPAVFAIGGIDENNCQIPVQEGADGVAVIRAVLRADDPADATHCIHESMACARTTFDVVARDQ